MNVSAPLAVIVRRKWMILAVFLVAVVSAVVLSMSLTKVYSTSATLLVAQRSPTQTFDTVQAGQAIARSYGDIIESPNIAQAVAQRMGDGTTGDEIESATRFEPVAETQLLKITAESPDPARAKRIGDTYASVFIEYARATLAPNTQATITLADPAPSVGSPSRPRPKLYAAVAGILGLFLGAGIAFMRETLDRRLRTAEDVEHRFDVPVLARLPRRGRSPTSAAALKESNRILRTNIQFATAGTRLGTVSITSGREGEGKTTTAAGLAVAAAEVGSKVIVVEGDLRRPGLQAELMPEQPQPIRRGLSNYLAEGASLDEVVSPTSKPGIDIVAAGPLPPNPAALLESRRAHTLMRELGEVADLVIVDCPPLNIGADASVMAAAVDGVLLIVDLQTSTEDSVRHALDQLEGVRARILGLVVNRDRGEARGRYSYQYYTKGAAAETETAGASRE